MQFQVFVKLDDNLCIIDGPQSGLFLPDPTGWTQIDEGEGDRYSHAQGNYLPGSVRTVDGIPLYRWDGENVIERTLEEIEADRANMPAPKPSEMELLKQELAATKSELLATQDAMATLYETIVLGGGAS